MYRIDNATATSTLPTPLAPGPVTKGYFQSGNPGIGQLATTVDRDWANATQEEFCTVIEAAGITLSKNDHTQLYQALQKLFVTRNKVTTNMTIYVSPTGSDTTGNGLTAGTAFATIQTAINVVYTNYDWNGHLCTIQLADGTYPLTAAGAYQATFNGMPFGMPQYGLTLLGNPANPAAVTLNSTNANCILANATATLQINGITVTASGVLTTTSDQGIGILAAGGSQVQLSSVRAVNCSTVGIRTDNAAYIVLLTGAPIVITGNGQYAIFAGEGTQIYAIGSTLNVTGFNASQAVFACDQGRMSMDSATFIGAATGVRYVVTNCGVITTGGGGANYLPGSSPGVVSAGGIYT